LRMKQLPKPLLNALGVDSEFEIVALPGNENENYLVKTDRQTFVVKKLRGHSAANTESEGVYRHYLANAGLLVAPYILLNGNSCVLTLGKDSYVATPYTQGTMAAPNTQIVTEAATLLACVHSLDAATMPKRQSWYRKNYIPDSLSLIEDKYIEAKRAFATRYADIPDFWNGDLPNGIIHGDFQEDNIIVDDQDRIVSVIDWEETAVEPILLDAAHSAQQLSFKNGVCNPKLFSAFMSAYQTTRPLTDKEKVLFDVALRYTMLVLSVWAHVKMSRGEMEDNLFQRVGNYYKASFNIPKIV
jgi:Ser/Thr protein kinase RdoA (MazF antagonist)